MKKLAALLVLGLVSAALVACGGSDDSTTTTATESGGNANAAPESGKEATGGGGVLEFAADPNGDLAYTTTQASTEAGKVTIDFKNPQSLTHDVAIEDSGGKTVAQTDLIGQEETSTTANLKPGTYTFYCSVPGHREAGMEGTLTVK
jgi:plastocyanin